MAKDSGKTTFIVFIMFMMCLSSIVAAGGLYVTSKEKTDGTTLEIRSEATNIAVLPRPANIVGRYNATSLKNDKWEDLSGKANHISADKIKGTLSKSEGFKGEFVKGTTSDGFTLPQVFDNKNWSFFAVARYGSDVEANQKRIFVSGETDKVKFGDTEHDRNWLIGHHGGQTGVAHYNTWVTGRKSVNDDNVRIQRSVHGTRSWIRITAQHNNVETNGQSRTTGYSFNKDEQKPFNNPKSIGINVGQDSESQPSDWNVYEILVYDVTLDVVDREKVDKYLKEKYILGSLKSGVEIAGGRPKIIGGVQLSVDEDKSEPWYGGKQRFGTQEDCRRYASELGYPQWGHYNEKYGNINVADEAKRNTCFFYGPEIVEIKAADQLKTDGETGVDDMTFGCTQPYRDPKLMCEAGSGSSSLNVTGGVAANASGAYCKAIKKVNDSSDIDQVQADVCGNHCTKDKCMDPTDTFRLGSGGASYKLDEYCVWNNTPDFETFYNTWIKDETNAPIKKNDEDGNTIDYLKKHLTQCTNFKYEVEGANATRILKNPPDTSRSASSVHKDDPMGTVHGLGRLDSEQAWSAKTNQVGEWYQINNDRVAIISGISIQTRKGPTYNNQRVESFKVKSKGVSGTWEDVDGGKIYTGNTSGTQVNVFFDTPVEARYIRIYPQTWNYHMSLRAGIYVGGTVE